MADARTAAGLGLSRALLSPWAGDQGSARARERFLEGEEIHGTVRAGVLASWERCRATGLSADGPELPYDPDLDSEDRLLLASLPVLDRLHGRLLGTRVSVLLTDAQARVMDRRAGEPGLNRRLDAIRLAPGFGWAEHHAGTNGIGTVLAEGRAGVILGSEHFSEAHRAFACAGAPIRDPLTGAIRGVVDLTSRRRDAHPLMAALAREAALAVEQRLLDQHSLRERARHDLTLRQALRDDRPGRVTAPGWSARPVETAEAAEAGRAAGRAAAAIDRAGLFAARPSAARPSFPDRSAGEPPWSAEAPAAASASDGSSVVIEGELGVTSDDRPETAPPAHDFAAPGDVRSPEPPSPLPTDLPGMPGMPGIPVDPSAHPVVTDTSHVVHATDTTGADRGAAAARDRLTLLWEAGVRIGTTLDVGQTADELAQVALPEFAQYATVDLAEWVPVGAEAPIGDGVGPLRRAATRSVPSVPSGRPFPSLAPLPPVGAPVAYAPGSAQARALTAQRAVLDKTLMDETLMDETLMDETALDERGLDPSAAQATGTAADSDGDTRARTQARAQAHAEPLATAGPDMEAHRAGSVVAVPLTARGTVLGVASFYRSVDAAPFRPDDLLLAEELAHRAAVCLDNARRFTREHALALALQRSLLPRAVPELPAIQVAHRYLPAQEGVGGDWFDVIPLSGARVALVVGDVVGHGIHAAATMGLLRTAVRNFSALDLPPEELLGHLDALVDAMDQDEQEEGELGGVGIIGATCLYVIYDPVTHRCTLSSAGHPSPAVVLPDGSVGFPEVPAGPPLGLGSTPFEAVELDLPEGSEIVLYTDGLIEDRGQDIDVGLARLAEALSAARAGNDRTPDALCTAVVQALLPQRPRDDVALLIATTRGVDGAMVARWPVPLEPSAVAWLRAEVRKKLADWGLTESSGTVELLVSELATNAIRHATGPVELRLLRDRGLICEVADGSSVSPRLRRARTEDESGRGLFLVAQLAERWGTRFTSAGGKVIWAELKMRTRGAALAAPRPRAAG